MVLRLNRYVHPFLVGLLVLLTMLGCAAPTNTSFDLSLTEARADLRRMRAEPSRPERPIVIAAGYLDPGFVPCLLGSRLRGVTHAEAALVRVGFFFAFDFDRCREMLIRAVEESCPSDDPEWTAEVDVIGFSMGGLVARYAALPRSDGGKRLRIRTLFTIGTPHRGARLSGLPSLSQRVRDMRVGSSFLRRLDRALPRARYELCCYASLNDLIVGAEYAAPPNQAAWWVSARFLHPAHISAWNDPRIVADIARRLRGETPWTARPPAPLPEG
ncbi:MAG: lipase family alpha/beta hydrolase [Phycisphaerales bacterium JB038]